ncbi:MAG: peptide chain release factor N(5)-glutamine methyltransferase [Cyclobacteriaceae bacterium]|nr:peptide chain release factor N(5)-glutamine methyltransferase [Cyclobacteriaceae bacterium]
MTNSKELFNDLLGRITLNEDKAEIQSIVYLILENKFKLSKTDILSGKEIDTIDQSLLGPIIFRINNHEPIQYILGYAHFFGRPFSVNSSVLIPRPETELLVDEIIKFTQHIETPIRILDIGTGSGCIAISLALEIPHSLVTAVDISLDALTCAKQNAIALEATVNFKEFDILTQGLADQYDLIVSNPPYITIEEKRSMKQNVLTFEPHLALFAPQHDPLIFYRTIASKFKKNLGPQGSLWLEINERFGNEVCDLLKTHGFKNVQILKDLDGKDRMIRALNNQ